MGRGELGRLIARNVRRLDPVASEIRGGGNAAYAYACDLTHEREVIRTVREIVAAHGIPALCIYAVEDFAPGDILSTEVAAFEESWRANCLGAFIVGREIGRLMAERGSGTLVFMGGTSSLLARAGYLNLAVGKHALRALALVMARELGPKGIHVAHCIIDGEVSDTGADSLSMNPKHVAHEIMRLHLQPNDCWTSELDLRPAREKFWEHC